MKRVLEARFEEAFDEEVLLEIGAPPKLHRFDLVSRSSTVVCECKAYTWTATGNVPSAKISTMREALGYLGLVPPKTTKILALARSVRPTNGEHLSTYFARLNQHLTAGVEIMEVSDTGLFTIVKGS